MSATTISCSNSSRRDGRCSTARNEVGAAGHLLARRNEEQHRSMRFVARARQGERRVWDAMASSQDIAGGRERSCTLPPSSGNEQRVPLFRRYLIADSVFLAVQHLLLRTRAVAAVLTGHVTLFLLHLMVVFVQRPGLTLGQCAVLDVLMNTFV